MKYCVGCDLEFETVEKLDQHCETTEHRNLARAKLGLPPILAPAVKRSKSKKRSKSTNDFNNDLVVKKRRTCSTSQPSGPAAINTRLISIRTNPEELSRTNFESCSTSERGDIVSPSSTSQSNVISKSTENLLIKSENSKNDPYINPADYTFSSEEVKIKQEEVKLEPIEERIKTENVLH